MAAIDKTYVNKEQLLEAIDWCKAIGEVTLENGFKFYPLDFVYNLNPVDDREEYVLWNTPHWFDRWLWINCPLSFVKERLQEQYDSEYLKVFEEWKYEEPVKRKRKYTFLKQPSGKFFKRIMGQASKNNRCFGNCKQAMYHMEVLSESCSRSYDEQTDQWYSMFGMLPAYDRYCWQKHHKRIPSKKAIIRQLNKWNLPKGTIVTMHCRYFGLDFKILVK